MSTHSKIEWTHQTWNPATGCAKISMGCANCYAERMAKRLQAMGQEKYRKGFDVAVHPKLLEEPYSWKKPRIVFVNSMSDMFHERVPEPFILQAFQAMADTPRHIYQVLTKRPNRLVKLAPKIEWTENIWMGVTVEMAKYCWRADMLRKVPAQVRFICMEPMLGAMPDVELTGIGWVILGGESGPKARAMKAQWVRQIRDLCAENDVPFFFKQWGGVNKKKSGRMIDGRLHEATPPLRTVVSGGKEQLLLRL